MGPVSELLLDGKTCDSISGQGPLSHCLLPVRTEWLLFCFVVAISIKRLLYWHSRPGIRVWPGLWRVQVIRNCKLSCAVKFSATVLENYITLILYIKNPCYSDHKIQYYANQKKSVKKIINYNCSLVLSSFCQGSPKESICPHSIEWKISMFLIQIILILPSGPRDIIKMELNKLVQLWKTLFFSISKVIYM